jgi:nucleoside-diphosphate-sugar epimerase
MFKFAITQKMINVNNPAIWRPILSIKDAAMAYIRAIEANEEISGVFNVASGNYTVGEIGDLVKSGVKKYLDMDVKLNIKHIQDYRNYKVSFEKAKKVLSFHPKHGVETIIEDLVKNMDKFKDFDNPNFYNIQVFKKLYDKE